MTLFTIGHSTRALDEFVQLLQANNVDLVSVVIAEYQGVGDPLCRDVGRP